MNISLNEDWSMASQRLKAFWEREIIDRPCVQVYVRERRTDVPEIPPLQAPDMTTHWEDPKYFFNAFQRGYANSYYLGEAFPNMYPNWEGVPQMLGSNVRYDGGTIWVRPTVDSIYDVNMELLRADSPIVDSLLERMTYYVDHSDGEALIGFAPLGNPGDTLAKICGYSNLLPELLTDTEAVLAAEQKMLEVWKKLYDKVYSVLMRHNGGTCSWLPTWYPGRSVLLEFDFAALISPKHFKLYLPYIIERAAYGDKCIYHLDGPDALRHLDTILSIKEVDAIQWEPGIACANICEWIPLMQKIQAAGKGLYVGGARFPAEQMLEVAKSLKPEGLILPVCVDTVSEGEAFLKKIRDMI